MIGGNMAAKGLLAAQMELKQAIFLRHSSISENPRFEVTAGCVLRKRFGIIELKKFC